MSLLYAIKVLAFINYFEFISDFHSARKGLLGELVLMPCLLIVAIFNTINAGILVDAGLLTPLWIVLSVNTFLCGYGFL